MRKMNKLFAIVCAAVLLTLTGCGDKDNSPDNKKSDTTVENQEGNTNNMSNDKLNSEENSETALLEKLASAPQNDNIFEFQERRDCFYCDVSSDLPKDKTLDIVSVPAEHNGKPVENFDSSIDINWLIVDTKSLGTLNLDPDIDVNNGVYYNGTIYSSYDAFYHVFNEGYDPALYHENGLYISNEGKTAFYYSADLNKSGNLNEITIPEGVTKIHGSAFKETELKKVNFPSTLETIESFAFENSKLEELQLPDGLKKIGTNAFYNCGNIKSPIIIPNSMTEVESNVFWNCHEVPSIDIGTGVTTIRDSFGSFDSIKELHIPSNVDVIYGFAFTHADNLETVIFDEGCAVIEAAFSGCPKLKSVKLPSTLKKLMLNAFSNDMSLEELVIPDDTHITDNRTGSDWLTGYNPNLKVTYRGVVYTPDKFEELLKASEN